MPILDPYSFEFISRGADQTRRIGIRMGSMLQSHDVVCLSGELGAGKTTLTQGIAKGWGALENATSPTFVIVKYYNRPDGKLFFHLDAYRLQNAREAEDLDIDLMINSGPLIVEWPERILEALPAEHLWVKMNWLGNEQRGIIINPKGSRRYQKMVKSLKKDMIKSFI
ncbi:MAG: tRNA (adenosine(37)-N6)-threonylcarbamoyltransferase complex ATPase subunit type 1 TsaE [Anaerolineaceae bacterium]|nr:tRNA (adenosine(37)-N6)-threonylcarbamoyltransferase complex ATPase subunit type 1 TsaE [Anaerolineaceae bacterium]